MLDPLSPSWIQQTLRGIAQFPAVHRLAAEHAFIWLAADSRTISAALARDGLTRLQQIAPDGVRANIAQIAFAPPELATVLRAQIEDSGAPPGFLADALERAVRRVNGTRAIVTDVHAAISNDGAYVEFAEQRAAAEGRIQAALAAEDDQALQLFDDAIAIFRKALDQFWFDPVCHFELGWVYLCHAGATPQARKSFEDALDCRRLDPDYKSLIFRHVAACHYVAGASQSTDRDTAIGFAIEAAENARSLAGDVEAEYELARYYALAKREDEAIEHLTEAVRANPLHSLFALTDPEFSPLMPRIADMLVGLRSQANSAASDALAEAEEQAVTVRRIKELGGKAAPSGPDPTPALEGLAKANALRARGDYASCLEAERLASDARDRLRAGVQQGLDGTIETLHDKIPATAADDGRPQERRSPNPATRRDAVSPGGGFRHWMWYASAALLVAGGAVVGLVASLAPLGWSLLGLAVVLGVVPFFAGPQAQSKRPEPGLRDSGAGGRPEQPRMAPD